MGRPGHLGIIKQLDRDTRSPIDQTRKSNQGLAMAAQFQQLG